MKFDINAPVLIVLVALLFLSTPVDSGEVSATLEAVTKEVGSESFVKTLVPPRSVKPPRSTNVKVRPVKLAALAARAPA